MRSIVTAVTILALLLTASCAGAQTHPMTPPQGQAPGASPPQPPHHQMMGQGMTGGGMMCPMMGGMMGMGSGMMGMDPGMMGMGGMTNPSDPKAMARMLKLRGDMLKAMGDVMLRHAQEMEHGR